MFKHGSRIVIDCEEGVGIDEILERFSKEQSRCKILTANIAKSMIKSGAVKSEREAAKVIAKENGEKENTIRQRIKRGKKVGTPVPKQKTKPEPQIATEAMQIATNAISQLERLREGDPDRRKALCGVCSWVRGKLGCGGPDYT